MYVIVATVSFAFGMLFLLLVGLLLASDTYGVSSVIEREMLEDMKEKKANGDDTIQK